MTTHNPKKSKLPNRFLCFEVTVPERKEEVAYALLDQLTHFPIVRVRCPESHYTQLTLYFPPHKRINRLRHEFRKAYQGKCSIHTYLLKDWKERWKKSFHPLRATPHLWICPSWETIRPARNEDVILIDPGMAFGTGHHPTTRFVLRMMDRFQKHIKTFLDVGTGSGVLAIGAERLGISDISAIDLDPEAVLVARENFVRNKCRKIKLLKKSFEDFQTRSKFDFVAANLETKIHLRSKTRYLKLLAKGGRIVLTGIHTKWRNEVLSHYRSSKLIRESQFRTKEWSGFCFKKA